LESGHQQHVCALGLVTGTGMDKTAGDDEDGLLSKLQYKKKQQVGEK
jgi:hypothetical protein